MNNNLQIFKNNEFGEIRVVTKNNEPWFVGKDVAERLEYNEPHKAVVKHIDEEDRTKHPIPSKGGIQETWMINESGLYSLILSSKLPTAKKFKRWVTSEVLPSIHKHGAYMTEQTLEDVLSDPDTLIRLATDLKKEKEERQKLQLVNKQKDKEIEELKPLATYTETILQSKSLVPVTSIAKDYGMSATKFNKLLHFYKIQYKRADQWFLYAKYHDKGYVHSKTFSFKRTNGTPDVSPQTEWTQRGRLFLYGFLKDRSIVPVIEKNQEQISMIN